MLATGFGKLVYICLLISGFLFSKDAIYQYIEGKTGSESIQKPIKIEDLPTLTICYQKAMENETENETISGICGNDIQRALDIIFF